MEEAQKQAILEKAQEFVREDLAPSHLKNMIKLEDPNKFNINPFLLEYLANFAFGSGSTENQAKALVYPRVLGTSITTTFGQLLQQFCNKTLDSFASVVPGMDIEFIDALDGRKKYCQLKSGPNCINNDDVTTIENHFRNLTNLARTNQLRDYNPLSDAIVGVFYGTPEQLSGSYRAISRNYPVYVGKGFWLRLTGDEGFYDELIDAFAAVANEFDSSEILNSVIDQLADHLEQEA